MDQALNPELPHAEGPHGMFGMVNALIVQP
jgi:hypothetical protein